LKFKWKEDKMLNKSEAVLQGLKELEVEVEVEVEQLVVMQDSQVLRVGVLPKECVLKLQLK
jgi:hypothetical protein